MNDTSPQLPKPITMTGTAFSDKPKKDKKIKDEKHIKNQTVTIVPNEEELTDDLPMPVVFGDDDEDNKMKVKEEEAEKPEKLIDKKDDKNAPYEVKIPSLESDIETEKVPELKLEPEVQKEEILDSNNAPSFKLSEDKPELKEEAEEELQSEQVIEINSNRIQKDDNVQKVAVMDDIPIKPTLINQADEETQIEPSPSVQTKEAQNTEETEFEIRALQPRTNPYANKYSDDIPEEVKIIENQTSTYGLPMPPLKSTDSNYSNRQMHPVNNFDNSNKKGIPGFVIGILGVLIGGGLVVGGYFTANKIFNKGEAPIQAVAEPVATAPVVPQTPAPVPPEEQIPTPKPATSKATPKAAANLETVVKKEDLKIKILNGSGTKGVANEVKNLLVKAGYKDITTGNADNFNYKKSFINYKTEYADFIGDITKTLKSVYALNKDEELETDDKFDFYIILGDKITETTTLDTEASESAN